jgi:hypothetical protein
MNVAGPQRALPSGIDSIDNAYRQYQSSKSENSIWSRLSFARRSASASAKARRERDIERGYSINVKQVVLAFAIEFVIIGLILAGQYFIAAQSMTAAQQQVMSAASFPAIIATIMNFPVALAMVELARVPLALAARTQNSWNIKFLASLGVLFAVTVTSFSLSTIAYQTFDPRLVDAQERNGELQDLKAQKEILANEINFAGNDHSQKLKSQEAANERFKNLQSQITAVSTTKGESCTSTTDAEGLTTKKCVPTNAVNRAQLQTLQSQLAAAQKDRDDANAAVAQAEQRRAKYDPREIDEKIAKAEKDFRIAVGQSQLHSYAGMIKFKAPKDVTEAEVKNLEAYLIFIPSIAAAFASTLIAITAVRRIKPLEPPLPVTMPDEAATYLFGPLLAAMKQEARDAVVEAMEKKAKKTEPPETVKSP